MSTQLLLDSFMTAGPNDRLKLEYKNCKVILVQMSLSILRELTNHHDKYVVAPADKESNNVLFLCLCYRLLFLASVIGDTL